MRGVFGVRAVKALALVGSLAVGSAAMAAGSGQARADGASVLPSIEAPGQAGAYCVGKGGVVQTRIPYWNTNSPRAKWLRLQGSAEFCRFTSAKDGSRIFVSLSTLYAKLPTLAALAYYAKPAFKRSSCPASASPGACYCAQLGGTDSWGGVGLSGGGWVSMYDHVDTVLDACIFPDLSTIDSYGLYYHQAGIIRGKNLQGVLRYPNPYK